MYLQLNFMQSHILMSKMYLCGMCFIPLKEIFMSKSMLVKRVICILSVIFCYFLPNEIKCTLPDWDIDNICQELDQLPLKTFSRDNILQHYEELALGRADISDLILVEIKNNTIFINHSEITKEKVDFLSQKSHKLVMLIFR